MKRCKDSCLWDKELKISKELRAWVGGKGKIIGKYWVALVSMTAEHVGRRDQKS